MNKKEVQRVIGSLENLAEQDCSQMNYDLRKALMGKLIEQLSESDESVWSGEYIDRRGNSKDLLTYLLTYNYTMHVTVKRHPAKEFTSFNLTHYVDQYILIRNTCPVNHDKSVKEVADNDDEREDLLKMRDDLKKLKERETLTYNSSLLGERCEFKFIKPESNNSKFGNYKIPYRHLCMRAIMHLDKYQCNDDMRASLGIIRDYVNNAQRIADSTLPKLESPVSSSMCLRLNSPRTQHFIATPGDRQKAPLGETDAQRNQRLRAFSISLGASQGSYTREQKKRQLEEERSDEAKAKRLKKAQDEIALYGF